MNDYPDYALATNKAYELLNFCKMVSPPFFVLEISKSVPCCVVMSYSDVCKKYSIDKSILLASSDHGCTLKSGHNSIVLYNEYKDMSICRFTVAHELGHVILDHNDENDISNKEADCFARNLLCPVPIAQEMSLSLKEEYADVFQVTEIMADIAVAFAKNDLYYIEPCYYNGMKREYHLALQEPVPQVLFNTGFGFVG